MQRERVLRLPESVPTVETTRRKTRPRLKSKAHEAYSRRDSEDHTEATTDVKRPYRGCWRRIAEESAATRTLDSPPRETMAECRAAPCEEQNTKVQFHLEATKTCSRPLPPEVRARKAEEYLDVLGKADINIWSDGSAEEGTLNGGAGAVIITKKWSQIVTAPAG
jgi:hypothetical protein